jgi:hypothetical protein
MDIAVDGADSIYRWSRKRPATVRRTPNPTTARTMRTCPENASTVFSS